MAKTVLIPAAGAGSRFKNAGINVAKPLIIAKGRTLLEHTLDCFEFANEDHLILAVQHKHEVRKALEKKLKRRLPKVNIHWFELEQLLPGQLATSVAALESILQTSDLDESLPLLIHNCDTGFQWKPEFESIQGFASMAVFPAKGTHWSFGQPDPKDSHRAIAIAEKKRISDLASIGLYGFSSTKIFLKEAKAVLYSQDTIEGEYYIAPMLHKAITKGMEVSLPRVDKVKIYGTPGELCECFKLSLETLKSEN
ncbi:NTP transferase domain-containing protein [Synechococcus sp. MU1617]|uniref:NTP transferase domain-containing protein n=1 Tax=Synechococcus sp. MU1617 TaxID=2508346 RepID=UPI001CF7F4BC|nr:NTP transferase domain-containing protein [Synechococcus sp. MU1617]MCB4389376.1 NTP transferase domain-containing protein [Synechococcus sp. MU1617]